MNKLLKNRILSGAILVFFVTPIFAAQAGLVPCGVPIQNGPLQAAQACTVDDFFQLLVNVYNFLLGLGGVIALLFIIIGGIQMILGFLDGGEHLVENGKKTIWNAVWGLVILACGYAIVNTAIVVLGGEGISQLLKTLGL